MPLEKEGPGLWKELHDAGRNNLIDPAWLHRFLLKLPCNQCKTDWVKIVRDNRRTVEESQFAWTVRMHNIVNQKIGKPIMSLEEAEKTPTVIIPPPLADLIAAPPAFELILPTSYVVSDIARRDIWAYINSALARGEKVIAEIKGATGQIDMTTLGKIGQDKAGNPTFGVGPETKIAMTVRMLVNVNAAEQG